MCVRFWVVGDFEWWEFDSADALKALSAELLLQIPLFVIYCYHAYTNRSLVCGHSSPCVCLSVLSLLLHQELWLESFCCVIFVHVSKYIAPRVPGSILRYHRVHGLAEPETTISRLVCITHDFFCFLHEFCELLAGGLFLNVAVGSNVKENKSTVLQSSFYTYKTPSKRNANKFWLQFLHVNSLLFFFAGK